MRLQTAKALHRPSTPAASLGVQTQLISAWQNRCWGLCHQALLLVLKSNAHTPEDTLIRAIAIDIRNIRRYRFNNQSNLSIGIKTFITLQELMENVFCCFKCILKQIMNILKRNCRKPPFSTFKRPVTISSLPETPILVNQVKALEVRQ